MGAAPVNGTTIRSARAELVGDSGLTGRALARRLSEQIDGWWSQLAPDLGDGWAVVAVGGYGAGLLAPGSDVDVVLVHPPKAKSAAVEALAERLWYPFWDGGLKLGAAVHSSSSLLKLAADDVATATSILRVRGVAGDPAVAGLLRSQGLEQWRRKPMMWLKRLRDDCDERWTRWGDVASRLEPELKDGRGGLRDVDMLRWAVALGRDNIADAMETPLDELGGPADALLTARCELHRVTGRQSNILLLQDQDRVAAELGYADADAFMLGIASAAQAIEWAVDRFWHHAQRIDGKQRGPGRPRSLPTPIEGVVVIDRDVHVEREAALDDPSLVLQIAAAAARHGYRLSGQALRALASVHRDAHEPWSERVRRSFISLLGSGDSLVPAVTELEHYGLFSRFLPEWKHVRSKPQRNAFHMYTVDRHLLQTVANASAFVRDVSRPDLLLMGALLHDLGKGYPGDHTDVGMELIDVVGPRMGFPPDDVAVLRALVQHHLLLPETAMRRDLSDPRTAANVAAAVGDLTTLELLHALTISDSQATGPAAWSAWKASLIQQLVDVVADTLRGQPASPVPADEARMADLAARVEADGVVHIEHVSDGDFDIARIASHDRAGLFAHIAGAFALHGLDVVDAAATTGANGLAVDEFRIMRMSGVAPNWTKVEHDLRAALDGSLDIDARLEQRLRSHGKRRRAQSAEPPRLEVRMSNDASDSTTVIDVRAPDGLAVLYRLSHALTELGVDIRSAKVATLGHEVVDVFYVQKPKSSTGQLPVDDFEHVRATLKLALSS